MIDEASSHDLHRILTYAALSGTYATTWLSVQVVVQARIPPMKTEPLALHAKTEAVNGDRPTTDGYLRCDGSHVEFLGRRGSM